MDISNLETVLFFYSSLIGEMEQTRYTSKELSLLESTLLYYGRYLNPKSRNYFIQTAIPHIAFALDFLSIGKNTQTIFDLGCGLGMQSIIFASLGAKVTAVDISGEAISLCNKRKLYYEKKLNMELDIDFIQCDYRLAKANDFSSKFDSVFSMSAFSHIYPMENTVQLTSSILKQDAKIYLYEKNPNHLFHIYKGSKEPSPERTISEFEKYDFSKDRLYGGCSLPNFMWKYPALNYPLLHPVNNLLRKNLSFSFNYVLTMKRSTISPPKQ